MSEIPLQKYQSLHYHAENKMGRIVLVPLSKGREGGEERWIRGSYSSCIAGFTTFLYV